MANEIKSDETPVLNAMAQKAWDAQQGQFDFMVGSFIVHGATKKKGQTSKDALIEVLQKITREAFNIGFSCGRASARAEGT